VDEQLDALVAGIIAGDAQAEERFCRQMRPELLRLALRMLAGRRQRAEEAEDAVQDGLLRFIRALRGRSDFRGRPRSYLRRIVYNCCLDLFKSAEWRRTRPESDEPEHSRLHSDARDDLPVKVTPAELADGFARLDERCRRLLERLYFEGVLARTIAEERSPATTVQAVYYRRDLCLRRLAFLLNIWAESRFGGSKPRGKS
jgi:RNA polymerase sigma factor (sigma-70 family)